MGIFAELIGAVAQAAGATAQVGAQVGLATTGAISKGVGEAAERGAGDMPIIGAMGATMRHLGESLSNAAADVADSALGDRARSGVASLGERMGDFSGIGAGILAQARDAVNIQGLGKAPEVKTSQVETAVAPLPNGVEHFDLADLGNFAPSGGGSAGGPKGFSLTA